MTQNRNGKTLIEMIAVMGIMSVIFGTLGQTFALMMRSESSARQGVVARMNLDRLASEFRNDVHAADRAALIADGKPPAQALSLSMLNDTVVEYRIIENSVRRTVLRERKRESWDEYRMEAADHRFEIMRDQSRIVALVHSTGAPNDSDSQASANRRRIVRIQAILGRDRRFVKKLEDTTLLAPRPTGLVEAQR